MHGTDDTHFTVTGRRWRTLPFFPSLMCDGPLFFHHCTWNLFGRNGRIDAVPDTPLLRSTKRSATFYRPGITGAPGTQTMDTAAA